MWQNYSFLNSMLIIQVLHNWESNTFKNNEGNSGDEHIFSFPFYNNERNSVELDAIKM